MSSDISDVAEETNSSHERVPVLDLRETVDTEQPIGATHMTKEVATEGVEKRESDDAISAANENTKDVVADISGDSDNNVVSGMVTVERDEAGKNELALESAIYVSSDLAEESVSSLGGRAESNGTQEKAIELVALSSNPDGETPRGKLVKEIKEDESLTDLRKLADQESNGCSWEGDLLFRHRLDDLGLLKRQVCLPTAYRNKCLVLSHDHFSQRGKNKVARDILRFFYRCGGMLGSIAVLVIPVKEIVKETPNQTQ